MTWKTDVSEEEWSRMDAADVRSPEEEIAARKKREIEQDIRAATGQRTEPVPARPAP